MFAQRVVLGSIVCLMAFLFNDGSNSTYAQRRGFQIGGQNGILAGGGNGIRIGGIRGVQIGGGEGLRFGPPGAGVQYGGGQGIRYGTPNAGVQIGAGQGFRMGTRGAGVQYGGGQGIRYGTPNAGVQLGAGQGARFGTQRNGLQFGNGQGLQLGRLNNFTNGVPVAPRYALPRTNVAQVGGGQIGAPNQLALVAPATTTSPVGEGQTSQASTAGFLSDTFASGTGAGQIILELPAEAKSAVEYSVNGTEFKLEPGKRIYFESGSSWEVGLTNTAGESVGYKLDSPGTYRLAETESGFIVEGAQRANSTSTPATISAPQVDLASPLVVDSPESESQETSVLESTDEKSNEESSETPMERPAATKEDTSGAPGAALDADGNAIESLDSTLVPTKLNLDDN